VKNKASRKRRKRKNPEVRRNQEPNKEATDYLVASLEACHSEVLTQYLGAMAKFHTCSFGNVMLIA
jgi:hypothetical protein